MSSKPKVGSYSLSELELVAGGPPSSLVGRQLSNGPVSIAVSGGPRLRGPELEPVVRRPALDSLGLFIQTDYY